MRCIFCGCTDDNACPGGCAWAEKDPPVCTSCIDKIDGHQWARVDLVEPRKPPRSITRIVDGVAVTECPR